MKRNSAHPTKCLTDYFSALILLLIFWEENKKSVYIGTPASSASHRHISIRVYPAAFSVLDPGIEGQEK